MGDKKFDNYMSRADHLDWVDGLPADLREGDHIEFGTLGAYGLATVTRFNGYGGHGAEPQDAADPIVAGASIIMALQTVVSRNIHPQLSAVVTVGAVVTASPEENHIVGRKERECFLLLSPCQSCRP